MAPGDPKEGEPSQEPASLPALDPPAELDALPWPADAHSARELFPLIYAELRRLAAFALSRERANHTLQPTALVNEAYLRLERSPRFVDRTHFLAVAAVTMRRVLVDYARARAAEKRGGEPQRITLTDDIAASDHSMLEVLALDLALEKLRSREPDAAAVVVLRFFGGLSTEEAGRALGWSARKAHDLWVYARAWIRGEMAEGSA